MVSKKTGNMNLTQISRITVIMTLDIVATLACFFMGLWFRADFSFENIRETHLEGFLSMMGPWCLVTIVVFCIFKLYSSIWAFVSTSEVFRILGAYVVLAVAGVVMFHFDGMLMPRSSMVMGYILSFVPRDQKPGLPHCRWRLYQLSHHGSIYSMS